MNFLFDGVWFKYFDDGTVRTRTTERRVEIPLALRKLAEFPNGKRILEVGNVLTQYGVYRKRTVVDLFEKHQGVVNRDIVTYKGGPFDLILSVSTFEHVGIYEAKEAQIRKGERIEKDLGKAVLAVTRCMKLLARGGTLWFTTPLGYNDALDGWLLSEFKGTVKCLVRLTEDNRWAEADRAAALRFTFNQPWKKANALAVCDYRRSE